MRGLPELRAAVARAMDRFHGVGWVDGDKHVTITCGTTEAMLVTLLTLVDENRNDEVILLEPWYENYWPQLVLCGATLKTVVLNAPDYRVTDESLARVFNARTRAIVVSNPGNPTGRVLDGDELALIASYCKRYDAVAVMDEIYCHYTFDSKKHLSMAAIPGMEDGVITVNGISKGFACTGWRVGWAITPEALTPAVRRVHDFVTATVPTPFQIAAVTALELPDAYFVDLRSRYERRRAILCNYLQQTPMQFQIPQGAYYILADVCATGRTSDQLATELLNDAGVAVVPGRAYYREQHLANSVVRLTFSKGEDTLHAAGQALCEFFAHV